MTSPDNANPPGAYNVGTVASMANNTSESVSAGFNNELVGMINNAISAFFNNILGGFGNIVGAVASAINQFISNLVYALKGITGGFIDLTGFFNQTATTPANAHAESCGSL